MANFHTKSSHNETLPDQHYARFPWFEGFQPSSERFGLESQPQNSDSGSRHEHHGRTCWAGPGSSTSTTSTWGPRRMIRHATGFSRANLDMGSRPWSQIFLGGYACASTVFRTGRNQMRSSRQARNDLDRWRLPPTPGTPERVRAPCPRRGSAPHADPECRGNGLVQVRPISLLIISKRSSSF